MLFIFEVHACVFGQLAVQERINETLLVRNVLLGEGMEYRNVEYTGYDRALGYFENGINSGLGIDKGIILSSGVASGCKGPNDTESFTSGRGGAGSPLLDKISGVKTLDAAVLEFEFKPQTNRVQFRYVFSSEEYMEWVDRGFNDVFGFFVSGPGISGEKNVALVPGTDSIVSIDNINAKRNSRYYVNNDDPDNLRHTLLQHDGQTVVLVAEIDAVPCEWYKIKLAIADVGDPDKDSWVFLEARSFQDATGLGNDSAYCTGNFKRTLNAGHPGKPVRWSTGETTQQIEVSGYGTYWVEVVTPCGSFKDEIRFFPAINPIDLGPDGALCAGMKGPILGIPNRIFETYLWSNGSVERTLEVPGPGKYWLQVSRFNCFERDTVEFIAKPSPTVDLGKDTFVCGVLDMTLNPYISSGRIEWNDGSTSSSKRIQKPGLYIVTADDGGCKTSDSIVIGNRGDFQLDIGPDLIEYCAMRPTELNTGIGRSGGYVFHWSDGSTSNQLIATTPGIYEVEVRDTVCDFRQVDRVEIRAIAEGGSYWVPNAFSPTNDQLNEGFSPVREFTDVLNYELVICNRWGEKVYESTDPDERWYGIFEGVEAPAGIYFWYLRMETPCLDDGRFFRSGTLQLLR